MRVFWAEGFLLCPGLVYQGGDWESTAVIAQKDCCSVLVGRDPVVLWGTPSQSTFHPKAPSHLLAHLFLVTPEGSQNHVIHFNDRNTDTQRSEVTCPLPPWVLEAGSVVNFRCHCDWIKEYGENS